jgi:YggT family protein
MFVFSNFLKATAGVLDMILNLYWWIVLARVVVSWVNADPYNPIVRFLYNATEPLLYRIRRSLPIFFGGIDFSPVIVLVAIYFLRVFLVESLYDVAASVR